MDVNELKTVIVFPFDKGNPMKNVVTYIIISWTESNRCICLCPKQRLVNVSYASSLCWSIQPSDWSGLITAPSPSHGTNQRSPVIMPKLRTPNYTSWVKFHSCSCVRSEAEIYNTLEYFQTKHLHKQYIKLQLKKVKVFHFPRKNDDVEKMALGEIACKSLHT